VKASIHNALAKPLTVYGLAKERGFKDSLVIAPDSTAEAEFLATTPGTYYYAGQKTVPDPFQARVEEDGQLNGAIVVEPDRRAGQRSNLPDLLVVHLGLDQSQRAGPRHHGDQRTLPGPTPSGWMRLRTIRSTGGVINATPIDHPMHLHGFYFRVDGMGDGARDTVLAPGDRRMTVTEIVGPGQTMDMTWSPTRPGNWIFHCHFAGHLS
jgi:FtsP/CotA-like multicopper oxidase with cupredoxin domain